MCWSIFPLILCCFRIFIVKEYWTFSSAFLTANEMIMWFLFWVYLCDVLHLWLLWFEPYSYFNEANLIIVNDLDVYLNSVFKFLIENFFIHIHQGDYPTISFSYCVHIWCWTWDSYFNLYIMNLSAHMCIYFTYIHILYVYICMHMYVYICIYIILKVIGFVVDILPFLLKHENSSVARLLILNVARWPSS